MKVRLVSVLAILVGTVAASPSTLDPKVGKVMALTRNTRATFSLFAWNIITPKGGEQYGQWSAEFHSGNLHRVESGDDRIVADCAKMTASYFDPRKGQIIDDNKAARVACGMADLKPIVRGAYLGRAKGRFGAVERIRIEDGDTIRTYSVDRRGAIVAQTILSPTNDHRLTLEAREVRGWVPQGIFSRESLDHSAVPEKFKSPPG